MRSMSSQPRVSLEGDMGIRRAGVRGGAARVRCSHPRHTGAAPVPPKAEDGSVRDFFDGVAVPGGDADDDGAVALDFALAAESAEAAEAGGFFDAVHLGLGFLGEVLHALLDVDVAGGAGADSAAGVLDVDAVLHGELEEGAGLAGHERDLGRGLAEALGVFKEEADGDGLREFAAIDVADVHEAGLR